MRITVSAGTSFVRSGGGKRKTAFHAVVHTKDSCRDEARRTLSSHHHESTEPRKSLEYIRAVANALEEAGKIALGRLSEEQRSVESENIDINRDRIVNCPTMGPAS